MKSTPTPGFLTQIQGTAKTAAESAEGQLAVISPTSRGTRQKQTQPGTEAKKNPFIPMGRGWRLDTGDQHWDEWTGEGERAEPPDGSEEKGKKY